MQENDTLLDIWNTFTSHYTHLFSSNSTLGRTGLETWKNWTEMLENKTLVEIGMETLQGLNETLQEGTDFLG